MNSHRSFASALVSALCLVVCQHAFAIPISGKVDMVGTFNLDAADLAAASEVTAFGPATVIPTPNGAFLGTAGSAVTFQPFSWAPQNTPIVPLWSFVSGGWTYTFDLNNIDYVFQNSMFLNLTGTGLLNITGLGSPYQATAGEWTLSSTTAGADSEFRFGFVSSSANSTAPVPDGGATFALLALALVSLSGLRALGSSR